MPPQTAAAPAPGGKSGLTAFERAIDLPRRRRLALIALTLQKTGAIEGRTKLQKIIYLANLVGWNAFDFKYHYYGPYSETLAAELDNMKKNGWVEEKQLRTSQDRILHSYSFSNRFNNVGFSLVNKVKDVDPRASRIVPKTEGLVSQLSDFDSDNLEIMATLMFLKLENPKMSDRDIVKLARELKPRFADEDLLNGRRIFKIMKDFVSSAK